MAVTAQLGVHATGPVGPVALSVHTTNLANQRAAFATARSDGGRDDHGRQPDRETSSTRHIVETA